MIDNLQSGSSRNILIFGDDEASAKKIASSLAMSLEGYRRDLAYQAQAIEDIMLNSYIQDHRWKNRTKDTNEVLRRTLARIPLFWAHNEEVLLQILKPPKNILPVSVKSASTFASATAPSSGKSDVSSYDSIHQTMVHLSRDWTKQGSEVRRKLYDSILDALSRSIGEDIAEPKLLLPGAATGRLALELAYRGYSVEANECSGVMVSIMSTIFNEILMGSTTSDLYPMLHMGYANCFTLDAKLQPVQFPDRESPSIQAWKSGLISGRISVHLGDFTAIYSNISRKTSFDAVVTCFFIDTAKGDVLTYLAIIANVLREGGIWINAGPLHYHQTQTVTYSYREVSGIAAAFGFEQLEESIIESSYAGEEVNSMKPESYNIPMTVWRMDYPDKRPPLELARDDQPISLDDSGSHGGSSSSDQGKDEFSTTSPLPSPQDPQADVPIDAMSARDFLRIKLAGEGLDWKMQNFSLS
jgi:hypothetical protein